MGQAVSAKYYLGLFKESVFWVLPMRASSPWDALASMGKKKKHYQSQNESNSAAKVVLEELASKNKTTVPQLKALLKWMAPKVALSGKRQR